MLEFCYELPYEDMDFTDPETHNLYRIGRGQQEFYWYALIQTLFVIIGDSELLMLQ